jgi:hypothetical protein
MSDVTNRVKEAFSDAIVSGASLSLAAEEIRLLASFTFMKAVVADHAIEKDEPFFAKAVRERLRQSLDVPAGVKMWIAAYQGAYRYSGKCVNTILSSDQPGPLLGVEFYSFTYVVGRLAVQLLASRWKDIRGRGHLAPLLKPNPYWNRAVAQFWPTNGAPISWPPAKYIGDDTIDDFVERFGVPINVS